MSELRFTAAVSVAGLMGAMRLTAGHLGDQRVVLVGAGSAGVGISRLICDAMVEEGLSVDEARALLARIYLGHPARFTGVGQIETVDG